MSTDDKTTIQEVAGAVLVRDSRGRFVKGTTSPAPITRDNTHEYARLRAEKFRRAAVRRITGEMASIDPTVSTAADAFGVVAASQVTKMLDSERPRIEDLIKLRDLMTGTDAIKQAPGPDAATDTAGIVRELAQFAATIIGQSRYAFDNNNYLHHDMIEADPTPGTDASIQAPTPGTRHQAPGTDAAGRGGGGGSEDMGEGG